MRFEKQSQKLEDLKVDRDPESFRLEQLYTKYPELRGTVEILRAREKGFKDVPDLRRYVRLLTPEELKLWADGTKTELEAILARRPK